MRLVATILASAGLKGQVLREGVYLEWGVSVDTP